MIPQAQPYTGPAELLDQHVRRRSQFIRESLERARPATKFSTWVKAERSLVHSEWIFNPPRPCRLSKPLKDVAFFISLHLFISAALFRPKTRREPVQEVVS